MTYNTKFLSWSAGLLLAASVAPSAFAGSPVYEPDLLPPNPVAGQCYARVEIPAQFSTTQDRVVVQEAYTAIEVEQPRLASRTEQVEVKEASVRYEVRQPRFKTITEQMMVRPSYNKLSVSQPQFQTITETVHTSAPRLVWKRGNPGALTAKGYTVHGVADGGRGGQGYRSTTQYGAQNTGADTCGKTCEIWCLVEEPGESASFNRRVMTSPGRVTRTPVPAKYASITKQVVADPGGVREIRVPAQYRGVTVTDVVHPGGERRVNVPAQYGNISKRTLTAPSRYEWRRVVCNPQTRYSAPAVNYSSSTRSSAVGRATSYGARSYGSGASYSSGAYGSSVSGGSRSYGSGAYSRATGASSASNNTHVQHGTYQAPRRYYYGTDRPVSESGH